METMKRVWRTSLLGRGLERLCLWMSRRHLCQTVSSGGMVLSGHHGLAAIFNHRIKYALVIYSSYYITYQLSLGSSCINPAYHRLAGNISQWLAWEPGRSKSCWNYTQSFHEIIPF